LLNSSVDSTDEFNNAAIHDVVHHKTGTTSHIATPPQDNPAAATGNMHSNLATFGQTSEIHLGIWEAL